jgi:hypothetical protein
MITITNTKIAGFEPRWASYRGFSLLLDNPGKSVSPMGKDWLKVNCSLDDQDLQLYKGFEEFLDEVGRRRLTNTYLFCPLPSNSYHVTVWDGLNDGNVQDVSVSYRLKLDDFLENLPGSLLSDKEFTGEIHRSPLLTGLDWSITFQFSELTKWGDQVLVARLEPADQGSQTEFKRIVSDRKILSAAFQEKFQVKMRSDYSPHVTLGYFANEEYAELASSQIAPWTELVKERVKHLTITFRSISLYGFTDMVTFFKKAQGYCRL